MHVAALGARYLARPTPSISAAAVAMGGRPFVTNNRRDLDPASIPEIAITFPDTL